MTRPELGQALEQVSKLLDHLNESTRIVDAMIENAAGNNALQPLLYTKKGELNELIALALTAAASLVQKPGIYAAACHVEMLATVAIQLVKLMVTAQQQVEERA